MHRLGNEDPTIDNLPQGSICGVLCPALATPDSCAVVQCAAMSRRVVGVLCPVLPTPDSCAVVQCAAMSRRVVGVLCSALSTPSLFFACLSASACSPASVFIPPACDAGILIVGNC